MIPSKMGGGIPLGVLIDSYKASHPSLYPPAKERIAYGEFRCPFDRDPIDHRIVFYGLSYIIDNYIARRWTMEDVLNSAKFFEHHNAGYTPYPVPFALLESIVTECDGWFPVRIEGLPEGSVCYPHTPVYVITARERYSGLITWLETILSMVWYPTTVATLSRRIRDIIKAAFDRSVESSDHHLVENRIHDFGFRGCTSVEQALIGGTAHLLSFCSSDTALAAYNVQYNLNGGRAIAQSIPATEHSVMLSYSDETSAILTTIEQYGNGAFAVVMDSYDYIFALRKVLPSIASEKLAKGGGFLVVRPDSGDPLESVLLALEALENIFGTETNSLGFKVLKGCGVIQGDGVNCAMVKKILDVVLDKGYSAQNVAFGMGSALLHRVHRDTMSFATKLSYVEDIDGTTRDLCKVPITDPLKTSLPGRFALRRNSEGLITVHPVESAPEGDEVFQMYYDQGPVHFERKCFEDLRSRLVEEWERAPTLFDPISPDLRKKQESFLNKSC